MKRMAGLLLTVPLVATAVEPSVVQVTADPSVSVEVTRRTGNTSKRVFVTVNQQDTVTINTPQPPPVDHSAMGPMVDMTKLPPRAVGFSETRIQTSNPGDPSPRSDIIGAFRVNCALSHMAKDDPIVYPGQPGKSHLHSFFGNTGTDAFSTVDSIANSGNSTCLGGTANRTAYWVPAMIDTKDGAPVEIRGEGTFYYKTGYNGIAPGAVRAIPVGLRMVAGNAKNSDPAAAPGSFSCVSDTFISPWTPGIPAACPAGGYVQMAVNFPQCWDGVNLDSPSHNAHVANVEGFQDANGNGARCPAAHPVPLPVITIVINYQVKEAGETARWRLSSDAYDTSLPGGLSAHADVFAAWGIETEQTWLENCLLKSMDCHGQLLGNGQELY